MLSVLQKSQINLREEVDKTRQDVSRLKIKNQQLLDSNSRRCAAMCKQFNNVWRKARSQVDRFLMRLVFARFVECRRLSRYVFGNRSHLRMSRDWVWLKRIMPAWRRVIEVDQRNTSLDKIDQLEAKLTIEQEKSRTLESSLDAAFSKISKLEAALRDSFVQQFQEEQQKRTLEEHIDTLGQQMRELRTKHESLGNVVHEQRSEIERRGSIHEESQDQLSKLSGELSLVKEALDDMSNIKGTSFRRFFTRYDIPGVLIALFHKVIDFQGQLRNTLLLSPSRSSGPSSPQSSTASMMRCDSSPVRRGSSTLSYVEQEVRQHICIHRGGAVSKTSLDAYVESLGLTQVSTAMATQVVLLFMGVDLGNAPCDPWRFVRALTSPPAWEELDVASQWDTASELATVMDQHRRRTSSASLSLEFGRSRSMGARSRGSSPASPCLQTDVTPHRPRPMSTQPILRRRASSPSQVLFSCV